MLNLQTFKNKLQGLTMLKNSFFWASLLMFLFLFSASSVSAQQDFNKFWVKFKTAVIKNDKKTVAGLTKFSLIDETEGEHKTSDNYTKSEFLKSYNNFFGQRARQCFSKKPDAKPIEEDPSQTYEDKAGVFCDNLGKNSVTIDGHLQYFFTKTKSGWKFTGFSRD